MIMPCPNTNSARGGFSETIAAGASSASFTAALVAGKWYRLSADVEIFFNQGTGSATASAAVGVGSAVLMPGDWALIDGACGDKLAVIQGGAIAGKATLTPVRLGR